MAKAQAWERVDADGRWTSEDGCCWVLAEPSEAWLAARAAEADARSREPIRPDPEKQIAALLDALAGATTLAQVRAAAAAVRDLR